MNEVRGRWLRRIQICLRARRGRCVLSCNPSFARCAVPSARSNALDLGSDPPATNAIWVDPAQPVVTMFDRRFMVVRRVGPVVLRVRAMRDVVLYLNGSLAAGRAG